MIKLKIAFCIVFCQSSITFFATEEKAFVLSEKDDAWLGDNSMYFLKNKYPQIAIAAHIGFIVKPGKLIYEDCQYLQKHINHAKNWLHYFNDKKVLDENKQLENFHTLKDSAYYICALANNKNLEVAILLQLMPLVFEVKKCKEINNNFGPSFFQKMTQNRLDTHIANSFLYFYQPPLCHFDEKGRPYLEQLIDHSALAGFLFDYVLEALLQPTMYELVDNGVINHSYQSVQQKMLSVKTFLHIVNRWKKERRVIIPKVVVHNLILDQFQEVLFLKYCDYLKEEFSNQVAWIHKNSSEDFKNKTSQCLYLQNPEAFKQWYDKLKYFVKEERD